ncbi:MAG: HD-GYP domain-containing protein [Desulfohalobiaceae bacterium]|nr:HD-GYP domain-containing protein [Desulfohalobiaceae bacterium]
MALSSAKSKNSGDMKPSGESNYFPISPETLNPNALTDFKVYLRHGNHYVLYTKEREQFSEHLKKKLIENGIGTVYIPYDQQDSYESYVFDNFEWILNDTAIPLDVRSKVFLDTTSKQVCSIFQSKLPAVDETTLDGVRHLVSSSLNFLSTPGALENIGQFISHDYETFTHSVHVFTYTMSLMQSLAKDWEEEAFIEVGVGALLHDIGKIHTPNSILNKPGKLDKEEWETVKLHPVHGMRMCTNVALSQTSLNCILFHHEKFDGSGYPSGMKEEEIPLPVRIITCCDVYDAITSKRAYAPAQAPFAALKIMSNEMKGAFDLDVFKEFIEVLGKTREKSGD